MSIKVKGRTATFTGKDKVFMQTRSKELGLSAQDFFTGMLWELIMRKAREGSFNGKTSKSKKALAA